MWSDEVGENEIGERERGRDGERNRTKKAHFSYDSLVLFTLFAICKTNFPYNAVGSDEEHTCIAQSERTVLYDMYVEWRMKNCCSSNSEASETRHITKCAIAQTVNRINSIFAWFNVKSKRAQREKSIVSSFRCGRKWILSECQCTWFKQCLRAFDGQRHKQN